MQRLLCIVGALVALHWGVPLRAQAPTGMVRGRVVDEATQQPLAGVMITVAGRGALTGSDGRYVLTGVRTGTDSVRSRRIGYAPAAQAVTVAANETVVADFALTVQAVSLTEMVVTGYGQQSAADITGAVSQIASGDFNPGAIVSPELLIQAKIAGVQVVESNDPGGGTTIRIRGATSVNANSEPLYVIDGMPLGTGAGTGISTGISTGRDPLNFLNPNDIQSITVLKDASAAAIYGANAANGVILITTKSGGGRHGSVIEFDSRVSAASVAKVPAVLNATQFRAAVQQHAPSRLSMLGTANTDWYSLIVRTAYSHEQNLSITNSGENGFYRLSLGYLDQQGVIRTSSTQRVSVGLSYDQHRLGDRFGIKFNLKASRAYDQYQAGDAIGDALSMAPTQPVYDPVNPTGYWDWPLLGAGNAVNPVASLNRTADHGTTLRGVGNVQADCSLPFVTALKLNVNLGFDVTKTEEEGFAPSDLAGQRQQGQGYQFLVSQTMSNAVAETYLNYAAPLHLVPGNVDVTAGYSYTQSVARNPVFFETGLKGNLLGVNAVASADNVYNFNSVREYKLISVFGRVNYNLNDRYLVAASIRRDGSSRFGRGNQWGSFPSLSLAWRISQEPFLRGLRALSELKLRAGWAKTGNQAFGDYLQYPTYTYGNDLAMYPIAGVYYTTIRPNAVDPNIHWETTEAYNFGVDFGLLGQRITGSFDWYTKNTRDLLFNVPVASGTNFSNYVVTNVGTMRNRGIELSLSAKLLEEGRDGLGWTTDFTVSHNANELRSINPNRSVTLINVGYIGFSSVQVLMPGQPVNAFYVYRQKYDTVRTSPTYRKPLEGQYVDQNLDGVINQDDLVPLHSPWPSLELGHTSSFTFRNFDFGFTLRAETGNYVYNADAAGANYGALNNGGSPSNVSAAILKTNFQQGQGLSDIFVEDASFLRMDNITLGYSFKLSGQRWRVYATVQNAFTITGYSGVDPTAGLLGLDASIYPRSRTFSAGLSARF